MYDLNGKEIKTDQSSLTKAYRESKKQGFSGSYDDYRNFVQDFYKKQIRDGQINLLLEDKAGNKVTPQSILDAYKEINNENASRKGQSQLFTETPPDNSNSEEDE